MERGPLRDRNVVVTGGAGFIGGHLVRHLTALGARVLVMDRHPPPRWVSEGLSPLTFAPCDLGEAKTDTLAATLQGATDLVHLAAEKHNEAASRPEDILRVNVTGTYRLFEAAANAGVRRVVFASSVYAYGRVSGPPLREDEPASPTTVYGISKLAGERLLDHFARRGGPESLALRFFFVYGPHQTTRSGYRSVVDRTLERLARGESPVIHGDGTQSLDYVHIDDVLDAIVLALRSPVSGEVLNVGSGKATTVRDLISELCRLAGVSTKPTFAPADATAGTHRVAATERAASVLGFSAGRSLEEGLALTLRAWDPSAR